MTKDKGVIVLIDAENQGVEWSKKALQKAKELGSVVDVRAFGDFRCTDRGYADLSLDEGVHCEQVFSMPKKNAADIHLCMYAVERLSAGDWDVLVLVSGDGDFLPLVRYLHRKKKTVVGVAEQVNPKLARACDEFVCDPGDAAVSIVDAAADIIQSRDEGTILLSDLGNALKLRDSSLIPRNFGFATLTRVIESAPDRLKIVSGRKTSRCMVSVADHTG